MARYCKGLTNKKTSYPLCVCVLCLCPSCFALGKRMSQLNQPSKGVNQVPILKFRGRLLLAPFVTIFFQILWFCKTALNILHFEFFWGSKPLIQNHIIILFHYYYLLDSCQSRKASLTGNHWYWFDTLPKCVSWWGNDLKKGGQFADSSTLHQWLHST